MKSSIKKVFHPVAKEFHKSKCGFNHNPADDFVRSQWQKQTKYTICNLSMDNSNIFFNSISHINYTNMVKR